MSGGVDSSVAAGMLIEQGYDVVGLTIKTYSYEDVGGNHGNESSCCSLDGINDARAVAAHLGFPHYVLDFSAPFEREVIDNFVAEYLAGRTPNPCVLCNRKIKWEELLRKAEALGADAIATGHYARVRLEGSTGRYILSRGRDEAKDQSYALWGLTQASLARTIFPLAELTKEDSRSLARRYGLAVAGKGESYEICFIPDDDYERFLKERVTGLSERVSGGEVVRDGVVVGKHRGFPFYTLGQRKGLGIAGAEPLYVTSVDQKANRVTIGPEASLYHGGLIARDVNFVKRAAWSAPLRATVKIRYKDAGGAGLASVLPDGRLKVEFDQKRRAITPGQSVVLYDGDDVLAGAIIDAIVD